MPTLPRTRGLIEKFERPVSWLVGRDLIAGLKWIALYTAFKGKIDPRDWMKANAFPRFKSDDTCTETWRARNNSIWRWKVEHDSFWRAKNEAEPDFWKRHEGTPEEEFWFDYISDTGDGQMAVYGVACLCLSDLWVEPAGAGAAPAPNREPSVELEETATHTQLLPRGQFLFVGGDTAYHIADYASLSSRFRTPFCWAFSTVREFLKNRLLVTPNPDGTIPKFDKGKLVAPDSEPLRPVFGVPGNHDYYDVIDGFNRQFRKPELLERGRVTTLPDIGERRRLLPQLTLPGFERKQEASYVAVHMPFGWWLWGLDTEVSKLDARQQLYFLGLNEGRRPPKLIVATPEPATVFRKQKGEDDKTIEAFKQLGLPLPFLAEAEEREGRCRLDLSGDVHHYARYYGPNTRNAADPRLSADHYASVVAGGGGAFHHPTETRASGDFDDGVVEEQVLYPPAERSRAEIAGPLFDLRNIFDGGYVWLFGMILTAVIYFALTVPETSKNFLEWLFAGRRDTAGFVNDDRVLWPSQLGPNRAIAFEDFWLQAAALVASVVLLVVAIYLFSRILTKIQKDVLATAPVSDDDPGFPTCAERVEAAPRPEGGAGAGGVPTRYGHLWPIWAAVAAALALYLFGVWTCVARADDLHPFACSLLLLLHLIVSGELLALSVQNSAWLAHRPKYEVGGKYRFLPVWALSVLAAVITFFGVWAFGRWPAAFMVSDMIFAAVVMGVLVALVFVGATAAGKLRNNLGKALFGVAGFWHAVLQLAVPLLLVRLGDWRALVMALVLILLFSGLSIPLTKVSLPGVGALVMKSRTTFAKVLMVVLWFAYGAALLLLPFFFNDRSRVALPWGGRYSSFLPQGWAEAAAGTWAGIWLLVLISLAAAVGFGFLLSMSWLSWYFGVSLCFQGHNNEVGGAARIERFKHIVRVCLRPNDLTAYVIAIDDFRDRGDALDVRLRLVDVFKLQA